MWTKRLEAGVFKVTVIEGYELLTGVDLQALLDGLDLTRIRTRKDAEKGFLCVALL